VRARDVSRRTAATSPSTGVIQWMLNNAWPSIIWHLYDYTLVPGRLLRTQMEPASRLHLQYSYATVPSWW